MITRLLAAKFGGHLTFAAMSPEKASAPGQPDIQLLKTLFNFHVSARVCRGVCSGQSTVTCWVRCVRPAAV